MKSFNCWSKSKDDKSMFQERIPVEEEEEEEKRVVGKVIWWGCRKHCQAPGRGKVREVMPSKKDS